MNNETSPKLDPAITRDDHLLEAIVALRVQMGEALNDLEFTQLAARIFLPVESGFAFASYCEGFVTLSVPLQNPLDWYPSQGWISEKQEKTAQAIARKYEFTLNEPPDASAGYVTIDFNPLQARHHLEFSRPRNTVIIAHPGFLKIRVFHGKIRYNFANASHAPFLLGPQLLRDLAALYSCQPRAIG